MMVNRLLSSVCLFIGAIIISLCGDVLFAQDDNLNALEKARRMRVPCKDCLIALVPNGSSGNGFSVACDLGKALPSLEREGYVTNQPISGARFIAKAKGTGTVISYPLELGGEEKEVTYGAVYITKNNQVILQWEPGNGYEDRHMIYWTGEGREILISDKDGFVDIDIVSGNGLYYENLRAQFFEGADPEYFLYNCIRESVPNLPDYDRIELQPGESLEKHMESLKRE